MNQPLCSGLAIACLLLAVAGAAQAQSAPPAKDAKETKEAKEAREAAEAMERARRLAANPMRVILEASRVKRRADGDAPLVPVVAGTATAAAPSAAPAVPVATAASPATAAPEVAARGVPPPPRESPAAVISSDLVQSRAATSATVALDPAVLPRAVSAQPVELPALAPLLPEISKPTLVTRVDPELPQRLLADVDPNTVVAADLTIRADGSVSQVALVTPNTRVLGRYIIAALQQWRFAPLPSERVWRVELLFRPE